MYRLQTCTKCTVVVMHYTIHECVQACVHGLTCQGHVRRSSRVGSRTYAMHIDVLLSPTSAFRYAVSVARVRLCVSVTHCSPAMCRPCATPICAYIAPSYAQRQTESTACVPQVHNLSSRVRSDQASSSFTYTPTVLPMMLSRVVALRMCCLC